jgi:hypothetical protein
MNIAVDGNRLVVRWRNKRDTTNPFTRRKSGLFSQALSAPIGYGELSVVRTNSVMFV